MTGNATYRYRDTAILSVTAAEAPIVVTSDEIDAQLAEAYERTGLRPGMLEALAGIDAAEPRPTRPAAEPSHSTAANGCSRLS